MDDLPGTTSLDDPEVSRRHCAIVTSGGDSQIRDLESRNQTLVNGIPIQQAQLSAGDEIAIGASVFRYSAEGLEDHERGDGITVLRPGDSRFCTPSPDGEPSLARENALKTLLRISNMLHSVRGMTRLGSMEDGEPVRARIESFLLDLISASRATVAPADADIEAVRLACLQRMAVSMPHPSQTGMAVLAAPILLRSDAPAAIYLERATGETPFDDGDLQFAAALAEIAAVAWDNAGFAQPLVLHQQHTIYSFHRLPRSYHPFAVSEPEMCQPSIRL